jgi:hypothetical protein
MKVRPDIVTEHALVRYLERVVGIDVETHRRDVARIAAHAAEHEGATAVVKDGWRYVLAGGRVVTVLPTGGPSIRTACCDRRQRD